MKALRGEISMADDDFDLIIMGAGPGGYVAGIRAAQAGRRVGVVEKRPTLGGVWGRYRYGFL
jgi:dihydrolipoamide dehydrogenase